MDKEPEQVDTTAIVNTFSEITSSSKEEAIFFLESHNWDLDSAVSTFLDNNIINNANTSSQPILPPSPSLSPTHSPSQSPSVESRSRSPSPAPRSRSPYRLRSKQDKDKAMASSSDLNSNMKKKKNKKDVPSSRRITGGIRTLADLNRPTKDDSDSDDSDEPQEYYTGGEKSGMLVQDPSKGNNVDAIFSQARQSGAVEGPADSLHPSQISKSFTGTGRLLSGETVSAAPQQPEVVNHSIIFWSNGFTVDDGPLRSLDDPANASFLESIRKSECPKELEPADRRTAVHVNLMRRDENYNEPEKPHVSFQGVGRTLGSSSTTSSALEPTVATTTLNTAPLPSMGLVVDDSLPTTSVQIRLADGTRMVSRFNYHHTINDIRAFIDASRPTGARNYQLQMMGFPPKQLTDTNQTLEQAGLANSVILQRLVLVIFNSKYLFSFLQQSLLGCVEEIMDLKVISILLVLLICSISNCCSSIKTSISKEEDMEFERQLKILNKQPVKTFQTNVGDIIDCVDIYNQPAFDHPMLKNHKLQLRPSSFPTDLKKPSSKLKSIKLKSRESCPSGTVPIKRTQKEDLIRVKSLSERRAPINIDEAIHFSGSHTVDVIMKDQGFPYYGATAKITTYNLSIAPDQASSTNMWIQSGPSEEINVITTGWKVSHRLNGDNLTRLFTYWTGDGYHKTGCYNTLCPGFVQTNKEIGPNFHLAQTSTRGGPIFYLKVLIFQDRQTGNWWLIVTEEDVVIGYFPKEIFSHLSDGARHVAWGGISNAGNNGISPPMGNGYLPNGHLKDTCSFFQVQFVNDRNITEIPKNDATNDYVDKPECFGLANDKYWGNKYMGYRIMLGGPGGNCGL